MHITAVEVHAHRLAPNPEPIRDALQSLPGAGSVQVIVHTDKGVSGNGEVSFGRIAGAPDALASLIEHELKPIVMGSDPAFVRRTHQEMLRETEYHGSFGLAMFGVAAIDTALWDCLGKALGVPCWQLWGAVRDRIPAYAMVGWLNYTDDQVQRICAQAVQQDDRGPVHARHIEAREQEAVPAGELDRLVAQVSLGRGEPRTAPGRPGYRESC